MDSMPLPFRWSLHPAPYCVAGIVDLRANGGYSIEGSFHTAAMPCDLTVRGVTIRKKAGADEFIYVKSLSQECIVGFFDDKWLRIELVLSAPGLARTAETTTSPRPRPLLRARPGALRRPEATGTKSDETEPRDEPEPAAPEPIPPPVLPPFTINEPEMELHDSSPLRRLANWVNHHGLAIGAFGIVLTVMVAAVVYYAPWKNNPSPTARPPLNVNAWDNAYLSAAPRSQRTLFPHAPQQSLPTRPRHDSPSLREGPRR